MKLSTLILASIAEAGNDLRRAPYSRQKNLRLQRTLNDLSVFDPIPINDAQLYKQQGCQAVGDQFQADKSVIVSSDKSEPDDFKVVGGTTAWDQNWPWIAGITINGIRKCGATLISDEWVLSAEHCFGFSWRPELGQHTVSLHYKYFGLNTVTRRLILIIRCNYDVHLVGLIELNLNLSPRIAQTFWVT